MKYLSSHREGLAVLLCCAAVYAAAVFARLAVIDIPGDDGAITVTTADAYGWLTALRGAGILHDHVLAVLGQYLLASGVVELNTFALYAPVLVASLAAPLTLLWGYHNATLACGVFAGLLVTQLPGFYARTSVGYLDSDAVVAPLLLLVILVFQKWHEYVCRCRATDAAHPVAPYVATIALSLLMMFAHSVHVSLIANTAILVVVSAVLERRNLPYLMCVVLISVFSWVGLLVSLPLLALAKQWEQLLSTTGQKIHWAYLGVAVTVLVLVVIQVFGVDIAGRVGFYVGGPIQDAMHVLSGAATAPTGIAVEELQPKSPAEILQVATGNLWLSVVGIATMPYFFARCRPGLFMLFPAVIGISSVLLGIRFALYLCVPLAVSVAYAVDQIAERLDTGTALRWVGILGVAILYWYQLFSIYQHSPPRIYGDSGAKVALRSLAGDGSHPCDVSLVSWDYGYMANFYAHRPTLLNGGRRTLAGIQQHASMLLATDEQLAPHISSLIAQEQATFHEEYESFGCRLEEIDQRHLHVLVTWRDLTNIFWVLHYSGQLTTQRDAYRVFDKVERVDYRRGLVSAGGELIEVRSIDRIGDNGVDRYGYASDAEWHLVYNGGTNGAVLLSAGLYQTFLVEALVRRVGADGLRHRYQGGAEVVLSLPLHGVVPATLKVAPQ